MLRALALAAAAGDLSSAAAFYERASFGKLRLHVDVTPWLHAYGEPLCPGDASATSVFGRVGELAQQAAARAGYDVTSYKRIAYILPERTCSPAGLGVGREMFLAQDGGALDDMAFVHELGQTFGLPHAQRSDCARGCRIFEYGDPLSPMGSGGVDFTALEKLELGWISACSASNGAGPTPSPTSTSRRPNHRRFSCRLRPASTGSSGVLPRRVSSPGS
jgi:Gametolysin peptidase M11